jgi:two-component system, NtrC family, response regulator HydG
VAAKRGLFEMASGGTLFLDEIGDMGPKMQAQLLRTLQDGEVRPVGGSEAIDVDVRLVCATNKDLDAEVKAGRFREDLFYRLDVVPVRLPPLRERREDILLLATTFLKQVAEKLPKQVTGLTAAAAAALERYAWPGNVRELHHAMERAAILTQAETIDVQDLPDVVRGGAGSAAGGTLSAPSPGGAPGAVPAGSPIVIPAGTPMDEIERIVIRRTLEQTKGDKTLAAQILGIAARTIYRKLDRDIEGRLVSPDRDE